MVDERGLEVKEGPWQWADRGTWMSDAARLASYPSHVGHVATHTPLGNVIMSTLHV